MHVKGTEPGRRYAIRKRREKKKGIKKKETGREGERESARSVETRGVAEAAAVKKEEGVEDVGGEKGKREKEKEGKGRKTPARVLV